MTPSVLNRLCAFPVGISWVIGACFLNVLIVTPLIGIASSLQGVVFLFLAFVSATGLGFFLGMFTCWPWIMRICSRVNGAPLKVGDCVLVLSRRHRGATARVYEITTGQGGWELARLDLGAADQSKYTDIFEEYSVLKINGEPAAGGNAG